MKKRTKQSSLLNGRISLLAKLILVGIILISQLGVSAQQKALTGTVIGEDGAGVPGVTVFVKGTTRGSITDVDGSFTIGNAPDDATLIFSFVGMKTQEVVVGDQAAINVTMLQDAIGLDEVVAIGYGTSRKEDLTGAIVNVKAEEFMKYQPASVADMLRSAVPGLKVSYSTSAKATPDFEIRGDNTIKSDREDGVDEEKEANKPLVVIDGVIFNGDLSEINPNDIESVDVLKDASAASIYGSRASNGVVVITTKKGSSIKPTIRFGIRMGIVTGAKRQTIFDGVGVMGWLTEMNEAISGGASDEWSIYRNYNDVPMEFQDDWLSANNIPGETDPAKITSVWLDNFGFEGNEKENYLAGQSYDWQDWLFHTGIRQDYNFSISGRGERVTYYWSVGYKENESVQVGEKFTSLTSRLNLDVSVTDFLNVGINTNFAFQDEGQEPVGNGGYRTSSPYDTPWVNGMPQTKENLKKAGAGSNRSNPLLDPAYMDRKYDVYKLFPTMYAKLNLPYGFKFTSNFTQRMEFRKRFEFNDPANPVWSHGGEARRRHNELYEWQIDNILSWNKDFGEHRIDATGLVNAERYQQWETNAVTSNFSPTAALGYHNMGFGLAPSVAYDEDFDERDPDETTTRNALMGRVNYSYGGRYYLSASIRRDGYSRFGADNVYATFPSISGAWNLTKEAFMADRPEWLTFLKARLTWGINGNSSGLGSYAAYAHMANSTYLNYNGGHFLVPWLTMSRLSNPALAWEKNQSWNFGLDYGLWDGSVRGALDVYSSETTELLLDKKLPIVTGFDDITTNVGNLRNTGFDLSINTINMEKSNFMWTSSFLVHYNKNEIVSLTGEQVEMTDGDGNPYMAEPDDTDNGWFIGESKDVIWDYEADGIYQLGEEEEAAKYERFPGDFRVVDQNNDGILNSKDKVFQGLKSSPWYLTFRNEFAYKNFDVGLVFLGKLGYKGGTNFNFNNRQEYIKNHNWFALPYWTPNNPINDYARINSLRLSEMEIWVPKSYVRFQSFSLGYNLPKDLLESVKFSSARVAFNIDNVGVLTKWEIGDPESEGEMPRIYSFSVDFSF